MRKLFSKEPPIFNEDLTVGIKIVYAKNLKAGDYITPPLCTDCNPLLLIHKWKFKREVYLYFHTGDYIKVPERYPFEVYVLDENQKARALGIATKNSEGSYLIKTPKYV